MSDNSYPASPPTIGRSFYSPIRTDDRTEFLRRKSQWTDKQTIELKNKSDRFHKQSLLFDIHAQCVSERERKIKIPLLFFSTITTLDSVAIAFSQDYLWRIILLVSAILSTFLAGILTYQRYSKIIGYFTTAAGKLKALGLLIDDLLLMEPEYRTDPAIVFSDLTKRYTDIISMARIGQITEKTQKKYAKVLAKFGPELGLIEKKIVRKEKYVKSYYSGCCVRHGSIKEGENDTDTHSTIESVDSEFEDGFKDIGKSIDTNDLHRENLPVINEDNVMINIVNNKDGIEETELPVEQQKKVTIINNSQHDMNKTIPNKGKPKWNY